MHNLIIKAVVTKADGSLFYREEHEWTNVDDQVLGWFNGKLAHLTDHAHKLAGKGEDSANLSALLTVIVDAVPQTVSVGGISYKALTKFEREFHKIGGELLDLGDERAKQKK